MPIWELPHGWGRALEPVRCPSIPPLGTPALLRFAVLGVLCFSSSFGLPLPPRMPWHSLPTKHRLAPPLSVHAQLPPRPLLPAHRFSTGPTSPTSLSGPSSSSTAPTSGSGLWFPAASLCWRRWSAWLGGVLGGCASWRSTSSPPRSAPTGASMPLLTSPPDALLFREPQ